MNKWLIRLVLWFASKKKLHGYARGIAQQIEKDASFRGVVKREGNIAFCPRCGQRPFADYRREEAFERILARFPEATPAEINFAVELAHRSLL